MQESVLQRLLLGDVPVGSPDLEAGDLHPADVPHGDAAGPVELDDGAVTGEVGQEEVAHLPGWLMVNSGFEFLVTQVKLIKLFLKFYGPITIPDVEHGLVVVAAGAEVLVAVGPVLHQDLRATQEMLLGLL